MFPHDACDGKKSWCLVIFVSCTRRGEGWCCGWLAPTTPRTVPTYKPESVVCILFIPGYGYGRVSRIGQAD